MHSSFETVIPAPIPNHYNYTGDFNVRHSHYRRIPNSQRSISPPPQRGQYALKVVQSVLCLPICRKRQSVKKADGDITGEEDDDEDEDEALISKNLEASIISSEEQTRAPEGDRLPVFTRLKDWTEHERLVRWGIDAREEDEDDDDDDDGTTATARLPPRSTSMPMDKSRPLTADVPMRSRTASDGQLPRVKPQIARTTEWLSIPKFEHSNSESAPSNGVGPPRLPPKIPLRKSLPRNGSPYPTRSSNSTALKPPKGSQNIEPPVPPPKIPFEKQDDTGGVLDLFSPNRMIPFHQESGTSMPPQRDYVCLKERKKDKKHRESIWNSTPSSPSRRSHDSNGERTNYHQKEKHARRHGHSRSPTRESRKGRHERYRKHRHDHHHRNREHRCHHREESPDHYWSSGAEMEASTPVWMLGTWRVFEAPYGWYDIQVV
ncbi:hypothetical protein AA313_de0205908 [Arthrobotrys entomopaga]|nr:hypothetical protein AA313_de0205908 [Arthrobotrys entomopaga]